MMSKSPEKGTLAENDAAVPEPTEKVASKNLPKKPKEVGGRDGPEPTRYGDWEKNGIISDF